MTTLDCQKLSAINKPAVLDLRGRLILDFVLG